MAALTHSTQPCIWGKKNVSKRVASEFKTTKKVKPNKREGFSHLHFDNLQRLAAPFQQSSLAHGYQLSEGKPPSAKHLNTCLTVTVLNDSTEVNECEMI